MKVLGIMGSPRRKGNTYVMAMKALEGAKDEGADTELIYLDDLCIKECDGCHACWKGKPCVKKDDMNEIYDKIADSDVLVFGTPVYWFGPTALMKAFIDRLVYFNCPENRAKIRNKKAILLVPFEDTDMDTARPLVEMFEKSLQYLEMRLAATILAPGVTKPGEVKKKSEYMDACYDAGRRSMML